jgi:hypothetical protein
MRQTVLGLFPTLEPGLKRMNASSISRNGVLVFVVVANLLTTPLFLYFTSRFWAPPGEEGLWGGPGDPIFWTLLAFPWLAAGAFANLAVIPRIATEVFYRKDFRLLFIWCVCVLLFASAYVYDGSRQFNGSLVSEDKFAPAQPDHAWNRPFRSGSGRGCKSLSGNIMLAWLAFAA